MRPMYASLGAGPIYIEPSIRQALYRAVDSTGATIDFLLSETRDLSRLGASSRRHLPLPGILAHALSMWMGILLTRPLWFATITSAGGIMQQCAYSNDVNRPGRESG